MTDVSETLGNMLPSEQTVPGYLFWLSRPRFWLYLAGPVVVGTVYAIDSPDELAGVVPVSLFLYFLLPANVYLYGVNDIFDADIDEHNPKKAQDGREVRYSGETTVTGVVVLSGALAVAFVPVLPAVALAGLGGFVLLGTAYSVPPLRLKTTPFLDSVSNGLYIMPAVVSYGAIAGAVPPVEAIAGGWVWAMAMHTFSAVPDIEPDRAAGIETTATRLGKRWTLAYCWVCWLFASGVFGALNPLLGVVLFVYPVFVVAIVVFDIDIARAYWWFPILNTLTGMVLTMGGLWVVVHG